MMSSVSSIDGHLAWAADFDRWWKDRMGLVEADTPVIPEYFVHKLSQLGTSAITVEPVASGPEQSKTDQDGDSQRRRRRGSLIGSRSPSGLWNFLNGRLRLMARMRKEWGDLHDVYGHAESMFGDPPVPKYIRDPESNFSVVWDLDQIVFLLYVSITVPYRAALGIEIEFLSTNWWFVSSNGDHDVKMLPPSSSFAPRIPWWTSTSSL